MITSVVFLSKPDFHSGLCHEVFFVTNFSTSFTYKPSFATFLFWYWQIAYKTHTTTPKTHVQISNTRSLEHYGVLCM